jgi:hypothetical protein
VPEGVPRTRGLHGGCLGHPGLEHVRAGGVRAEDEMESGLTPLSGWRIEEKEPSLHNSNFDSMQTARPSP